MSLRLTYLKRSANSRNLLIKLIFVLVLSTMTAACGTLPHKAVPERFADKAELPGFKGIRYWGDEVPDNVEEQANLLAETFYRKYASSIRLGKPIRLNTLALSGGGEDGAFGVGLLLGWSARGTRPEFQVVTGISAGALIAPFAFLGSQYDTKMKDLLLSIPSGGALSTSPLSLLFGISLVDGNPLAKPVQRFITQEILDEIGRAHLTGRRLLIGTTNLDAGRPVIWDIGKLANSGNPDTLKIFRKIILASAAIPGVFAPVLFDVEVNGRHYNELHVDGGVAAQVFVYPPPLRLREVFSKLSVEGRLYIIRNRKLDSGYQDKIAGLFSITARSLDIVIKNQGNGDLYQIYLITQLDGIDYNLAYIPPGFDMQSDDLFDQYYVRALFDYGYELGKAGYSWSKSPPGIDPSKTME